MSITSGHRYVEDFTPGQRIHHRRGHTVADTDNQFMSLLTMNTAQTHFNTDSLSGYMDGTFQAPLLNACVALAIAVGLTSEDMSENLLADIRYDAFRMPAPIFVGDTLYASSTVHAVNQAPGRADGGVVEYDIEVKNASGQIVLTVRRSVLLKCHDSWAAADERATDHLLERAIRLLGTSSGEHP